MPTVGCLDLEIKSYKKPLKEIPNLNKFRRFYLT